MPSAISPANARSTSSQPACAQNSIYVVRTPPLVQPPPSDCRRARADRDGAATDVAFVDDALLTTQRDNDEMPEYYMAQLATSARAVLAEYGSKLNSQSRMSAFATHLVGERSGAAKHHIYDDQQPRIFLPERGIDAPITFIHDYEGS